MNHNSPVGIVLVSSYAHKRNQVMPEHVQQITVDPDREAADLRIANLVTSEDVVITDDFGLASLLLAKGADVLSSRGMPITDESIDFQLDRRYHEAKLRKSKKYHKGPKPFTDEDREHFRDKLKIILQNKQEK
ncbi:DUF188 domain-containing protein [Salisediminibacterium beveridgei]|nr:DUF188 domain-containing protein [Salisediminibacterium beveridgei]